MTVRELVKRLNMVDDYDTEVFLCVYDESADEYVKKPIDSDIEFDIDAVYIKDEA